MIKQRKTQLATARIDPPSCFSNLISQKRRGVPAPTKLVENGHVVTGTFNSEFVDMQMLKCKNPTHYPDFLNKLRLTLWQAAEVHTDDGILLVGASDMGVMTSVLCVYYQKHSNKVLSWSNTMAPGSVKVAKNLLCGSCTVVDKKKCSVKFENNLQDGIFTLSGKHTNAQFGTIEYDLIFKRASIPQISVMPMEMDRLDTRAVYTQKDLMRVEGRIVVGGKEACCNLGVDSFGSSRPAVGYLDDHKGYYLRHSHYDWLAFMGYDLDAGNIFGMNLCQNQCVDAYNYNENALFLDGRVSLLEAVEFERDKQSAEGDDAIVRVRDHIGMVDVTYKTKAQYKMVVHAMPLLNIEYFISFGELGGKVCEEDGTVHVLDGMIGIGEDKTMVL